MYSFDELLGKLEEATDLRELETMYLDLTAEWNVSAFSISFISPDNPIQNWAFTSAAWPQKLVDEYNSRNMTNHDPVMRHIATAKVPFTYREVWDQIEPDEYQKKILEIYSAYGIVNAVIVPIRLTGTLNIGTLLTDMLEFSKTDLRRIHLRTLAAANVAAYLLQDRPKPISSITLTERDREVLRWVALGRSSKDVADILGISESGVNKHLSHAQEILDAKNRTEAVASAIRKGLIEF